MRFFRTPAEDAGGLNTGSGGRSRTSPQRRGKKMKGAMSNLSGLARSHEQWARFRFSVIGPLLAAPPDRGELQEQLQSLAAKKWCHPITGQRVQFGLSTIERWFYTARNEKKDPVQALRRKIRSDQGLHPALSPKVRELLAAQYRQHPNWSYQLHADNLAVLIEKEPTLVRRSFLCLGCALHESSGLDQAPTPWSGTQSRRPGHRASHRDSGDPQL